MTNGLSEFQAKMLTIIINLALLILIGVVSYLYVDQANIRREYVPLEQYRIDTSRRDKDFCEMKEQFRAMGIRINEKLDKIIMMQK